LARRKISDERFHILHRAGWSIGDTACIDADGMYWLVYSTQGGSAIRVEARDRGAAWKKACREAKALGLIEAL
jgi:hypothetical protein